MSFPIQSIITSGSDGIIIDAECHISNGLPAIIIVGLAGKAIEESKERIRSAYASGGLPFPRKRITLNLAPADIPKDATSLDLAMACAIIASSMETPTRLKANEAVIGELGLDGNIRAVRGIIGKLLAGKRLGIDTFYIPAKNLHQAQLVPGLKLFPVRHIKDMYDILIAKENIEVHITDNNNLVPAGIRDVLGLSQVAGQERAKRALEVAAAGNHNVLLSGPPGTGKSMLAKAIPSILPPMSQEEILEVTHLHSLASLAYDQLVTKRPFRAPHHSISHTAMVGGGMVIKPGEITLSHRGVLFLDEMPEFQHSTLEALRQPLEERTITIARSRQSLTFPASFLLIGTANPCPCGYAGSDQPCICTPSQVIQYKQKMSGPIMDRIDIHVVVDRVEHDKLLALPQYKNDDLRIKRISDARLVQFKRFKDRLKLNCDMDNADLRKFSFLEIDARKLLDVAAQKLRLSARSYMRAIRVARTIADIEHSDRIQCQHISEVLQYRMPGLYDL